MARKRQYGSGCLLRLQGGWAIRWRETEIGPDGESKRLLRYETLVEMSRKQASDMLAQRIAAANTKRAVAPSTLTFRELAVQWQATVLPMYKHSTQKNHGHILEKHLLPRFGNVRLTALGRQDVQAYVAHLAAQGYAAKTIDHIHDVLSAVLRTAVKWDHLPENPARGVELPRLTTVRQKWALTVQQAADPARGPAGHAGHAEDPGRHSHPDRRAAGRAVCPSLEGCWKDVGRMLEGCWKDVGRMLEGLRIKD